MNSKSPNPSMIDPKADAPVLTEEEMQEKNPEDDDA